MLHPEIPMAAATREPRVRRGAHTIDRHALPVCATAGEPRYRDRAQARDGLRSASWTRERDDRATAQLGTGSLRSVKCQGCKGWHNLAEPLAPVEPVTVTEPVALADRSPSAKPVDTVIASHPVTTPAHVARKANDMQMTPHEQQNAMHGIDIENQLVSKGRKLTLDDVRAWVEVYWNQGPGVRDGDLVIVAVSPRSMWMLKAFVGKRIRACIGHTGPDGADEALLAAIYVPDMAARYPVWNIASGDGAFAGLAKQATRRGIFVRMVTTGDTLIAPKLRAAVHVHTRIRTTSRTQVRAQQMRNVTAIQTVRGASRVA